jgi:hypothetical protein
MNKTVALLVFSLIIVGGGLSVASAEITHYAQAAKKTCSYASKDYAPGARTCQAGKPCICFENGEWGCSTDANARC